MVSFITSFFAVFLAEIADKTMLLTLGLSARMKKIQLIVGVLLASFVVMLIPILLGEWLTTILPRASLVLASGLLFVFIGIFTIIEKGDEEEKEGSSLKLPDFLKAFLIFLIAEMGDKTQLTTFSLVINSRESIPLWIGASLGLFLPNLLAIFVGATLLSKINKNVLKYIVGGLFLAVGITILLEYFGVISIF